MARERAGTRGRPVVPGVDVGGGEKQRRRVLDYLIDVIEPSPRDEEVAIEICTLPNKFDLLYVKVEPKEERRPYALMKGSGRLFLIRVGDRNRPMSREEIAGSFNSARTGLADHPLAEAEGDVLELAGLVCLPSNDSSYVRSVSVITPGQ